MWWKPSKFPSMVAIAGHPDLESLSKLTLPLLNSTAQCWIVNNDGTSSFNVATISAWKSLGAKPIFCWYLGLGLGMVRFSEVKWCPFSREVTFCCIWSLLWTVGYQFTRKETIVLLRKAEINACKIPLLASFLQSQRMNISALSRTWKEKKCRPFANTTHYKFIKLDYEILLHDAYLESLPPSDTPSVSRCKYNASRVCGAWLENSLNAMYLEGLPSHVYKVWFWYSSTCRVFGRLAHRERPQRIRSIKKDIVLLFLNIQFIW